MARPSELDGHGQVDDGHAVGLQHGRPDGLQGPGPVQYHEVRRQAAEGRANDEDAEAVGVDELAPDHVGKRPTAVTMATSTNR